MTTAASSPVVDFGYRSAIADWTRENLDRFDVVEIRVDHCMSAGGAARSKIFDLVGKSPSARTASGSRWARRVARSRLCRLGGSDLELVQHG
jgi:hypothetical protein